MMDTKSSTSSDGVLTNVGVVRAPVLVSSTSSLDTSTASTGSITRRSDQDTFSPKQDTSNHSKVLQLPPLQTTPHFLQKGALQQYQLNTPGLAPVSIPHSIPQTRFPINVHSNSNPVLIHTDKIPIAQQQKQNVTLKTNTTSNTHSNNVPEFLYQLTKLLTDDNRAVIEWSKGKIEVHNPPKLASDILHKYFRHSKYASFQRQLNYFGFRKLAGKGKMSPCSYINDEVTEDIRSLLNIKRKTTGTKDKKAEHHVKPLCLDNGNVTSNIHNTPVVNPVLAGILNQTLSHGLKRNFDQIETTESNPHFKVAVGKGIKHKLNGYLKPSSTTSSPSISSTLPLAGPNMLSLNQNELAKSVVGRGITHQYSQNITSPTDDTSSVHNTYTTSTSPSTRTTNNIPFTFLDPHQLGMGITDSLSELKNNYNSSLESAQNNQNSSTNEGALSVGNGNPSVEDTQERTNRIPMSRIASLVDLAMIPTIENEVQSPSASPNILDFLDFTNEDMLNEKT